MNITLYQVDAFTDELFAGNPAAVCPLDAWLSDDTMLNIAMENNLSETAFFIPEGEGYNLRWFTPGGEVDLCGHATLATAHVLYTHLNHTNPDIRFNTRSGELVVRKTGDGYFMDFPATRPVETQVPQALVAGLGKTPSQVLAGSDYIVVLETEEDVAALEPDFTQWLSLDLRGVLVTAPGTDADFVSRCFFPKYSVNEDPVTGSAHCELAPYWSERLNKKSMTAIQRSERQGKVGCEVSDDRVFLTGAAVDYMVGTIRL